MATKLGSVRRVKSTLCLIIHLGFTFTSSTRRFLIFEKLLYNFHRSNGSRFLKFRILEFRRNRRLKRFRFTGNARTFQLTYTCNGIAILSMYRRQRGLYYRTVGNAKKQCNSAGKVHGCRRDATNDSPTRFDRNVTHACIASPSFESTSGGIPNTFVHAAPRSRVHELRFVGHELWPSDIGSRLELLGIETGRFMGSPWDWQINTFKKIEILLRY